MPPDAAICNLATEGEESLTRASAVSIAENQQTEALRAEIFQLRHQVQAHNEVGSPAPSLPPEL